MEKNELINFQDVEKRLIWLDGQRVLPDFAVAELYGVETNVDMTRFAVENFDRKTKSKSRYLPKAFTEKGLYMLATILKSPRATQTTIAI
jgi:hypothetical protein